MSGLSPLNVRRPHILDNLRHRQGAGATPRRRPLLPHVAQPRHAHQHHALHTD